MTIFKPLFAATLLLLIGFGATAQVTAGKIVFERKVNLYKKYKDDDPKEWIKEEDKLKVDKFELYFNDTASAFIPVETDLKERMSWATAKNKVYQNFSSNTLFAVKTIWGEELHVTDSLKNRTWKILPGTRKVAGYDCRKALWQVGDSIKIYAWYTNEIQPSVGPETYFGLPGAILGLGTEDGGVIYMAREVQTTAPTSQQISTPKNKQKIYQTPELRAKLTKDFGKQKWGRTMIKEHFDMW